MARSGGRPDTRESVIVAFADEIAATPEMLARYAKAITGADPVTLVVAVQPGDADALMPAVSDAAEAVRLTREYAADVLVYACESPEA